MKRRSVSLFLLAAALSGTAGILIVRMPVIAQEFSNTGPVFTSSAGTFPETRQAPGTRRFPTLKPASTKPGPWDDTRNIMVKFRDDLRMTLGVGGYPADRGGKGLRSPTAVSRLAGMTAAGGSWVRMSGASESETERLRLGAERNLNREIGRLNNYFILHVPDGASGTEWIDGLNALDDVEIALFVPLPAPLPVPGSYQARQGYLNTSTDGIDAGYAWSIGDSGQNVSICDFEYWWNLSHQDLPAGMTTLVPPGWTPVPVGVGDTNHGTAVLGELASLNNGWGTTGAAYGSTIYVAHTNFSVYGWQIGTAMLYAMTQLSPGDVLLIEQQMQGPNFIAPGNDTGLVPIEWWRPWYDVVVTAVGNGFHVVEAAGNGYQDLDWSVYGTGNGGHWPFLPQNNSGAVMVGAGAAPSSFYGTDTARSRLNFSNYGSRLDLQGWGEFVVTTGYGRLYSSEGVDLWYDSSFAGTSSASPIVAAAVALVESRFETLYGGTMAPATMRSILKNTGTAQQAGANPLSENIGPLPDLSSALNFAANTLAGGTYQVGLSRTYTYLTNAAADLSGKILSGNVTFELMSDYTSAGETFPIVFSQYTAAGGNWNVTIHPAAGVTSRATIGSPPPYQPLIHLFGADRITFDGRPGGTGASGDWLIRNSRTDSTAPAILFSNGADDNILEYLRVESQCTTATYGTIAFGWGSDSLGNRRNRVEHNIISDRSDVPGLPHYALSSGAIVSVPNDSNSIVGNDISNWDMTAVSVNGDHWTIDSNSFYMDTALTAPLTGIVISWGDGHRIRDNHLGGDTVLSGGGPLVLHGNFGFTGIQVTVDTLVSTAIERNVIRNINLTSTGPATFIGIEAITFGKVDILDNVIGDTSTPGIIWVSGTGYVLPINVSTIHGGSIRRNTVVNIRQTHSSPGELRCISLYSPGIFRIERNHLYFVGPIKYGAPGYVRGIFLDTYIDSVLIANNMIALGMGDTTDVYYTGIYDNCATVPAMVRVDVVHNSIAIGGVSTGIVASEGLIRDAFSPSHITLRNNAINNLRSGGSGKHYALVNASIFPGWNPGDSDFNVLLNLNPAVLAHWWGADVNFPAWRGLSLGDTNSFNADPMFLNPTTGDLHIDPAVWSSIDNAGTPLATVTDDFDGTVRGGAPDIGADEYTINFPAPFTFISPPHNSVDRPVSDTLRWHSSAASIYDVYIDSVWPSGLVASDLQDTFYVYGPLDTNKTWYWLVYAKNSSGALTDPGYPWTFSTGPGSALLSRSYPYDSSWNMLSVPLDVADFSKGALYPQAVSRAFIYSDGYQDRDTLAVGTGFWIKFGDTGSTAMIGYRCDPETVDVARGWNIVGSIADAVTVSSISSIPGGIVTSPFYGYSGGYYTTDTIVPGLSYWVKTSQAGKIILTTDTAAIAPVNRIRVTPIAELPPAPPLDGETSGVVTAVLPTEYGLDQNYPNPFNSRTAIGYRLPDQSMVSIRIYDLLGREVSTLLDRVQEAGEHVVFWNGEGRTRGVIMSGVYLCRIRAVGSSDPGVVFSAVRKILLIK